jgi:hypothetical protein
VSNGSTLNPPHTSSAGAPTTPLQHLQQQFALIKLGGELRVVDLRDYADFLAGNRANADALFYKRADAEILMRRVLESLGMPSNPKVEIGAFWASPSTHVYDRTAFDPRPQPATTLNFWSGPTLVAAAGNWSSIKTFLQQIICAGDQGVYDDLIKRLAHMLQKPHEKPGVMVVLLGGQGTGKGSFFTLLRRIWPRTTLQVTDVDSVIGKFNAALERNFVICMDEALFSGDRRSLDRLKSLITENVFTVEQKFEPARVIDSCHRVFAASNHQHFAHIETDDRRFLFLRVAPTHKQDHAYFRALHQDLGNDAVVAAMLWDLERLDLTHFDPRQRPATREHARQRLKSLIGFDRYWHELLQAGALPVDAFASVQSEWLEGAFVGTETLLNGWKQYDRGAGRHQPVQSAEVVEAIRKLCPTAVHTRTQQGPGRQARGFRLPDLITARREFAEATKLEIDWEDNSVGARRAARELDPASGCQRMPQGVAA